MEAYGIQPAEAPDDELRPGAAAPHEPPYRGTEAAEPPAEDVQHVGDMIAAAFGLHGIMNCEEDWRLILFLEKLRWK